MSSMEALVESKAALASCPACSIESIASEMVEDEDEPAFGLSGLLDENGQTMLACLLPCECVDGW